MDIKMAHPRHVKLVIHGGFAATRKRNTPVLYAKVLESAPMAKSSTNVHAVNGAENGADTVSKDIAVPHVVGREFVLMGTSCYTVESASLQVHKLRPVRCLRQEG
jgi:hypothetical protein